MTVPKALMEKFAERFQVLPDVWLQNALFEQTKDYLMRGRRFGHLKIDQLNEEWAKAFRQFVRQQVESSDHDMDDAGAELRLRGQEFPTYLVRLEVEQLRAAIERAGLLPLPAEVDRKIDEFVQHMSKAKN